jgi:DNA-binding MarR family transcriptional regulator/predicted GNAT family acetyltransferase
MEPDELMQRIEAVRRFNRFYTHTIGVLTEQYLESPFSVAEARVIYELAHQEQTTATHLGSQLGLDAGYLSRILRGFVRLGLIEKQSSQTDGRQNLIRLTDKGREEFKTLNARSHSSISALLNALPSAAEQKRLVDAMGAIEQILGARPEKRTPIILRPPQPGDMGWVVHRHGVLYAQEYGWDEQFEALVAEIVAKFVQEFDPRRERCWIAEIDGEAIGSVFLVKKSDTVAKLRLLLVEPKARGLGLGARLVNECIRFARQAGYQSVMLWTNSNLIAARTLYAKTGFQMIEAEAHHSFGHDLVGETWELVL